MSGELTPQEETMSTISASGLSPYDVIAFIQEHTQAYSSMIKDEMGAAQDRTHLVKDIADLQAGLETCKTSGDWTRAHTLIEDFQKTHRDAWGGGAHDMCEWISNTKAWSEGVTIDPGSYKQENFDQGDSKEANGWNSFHSTWQNKPGLSTEGAQGHMEEWIKNLDSWKDTINSDDKIGLMTLQEHAEDLKNLYETGSNLNAKTDQVASLIISNMGKG
jgi:hypothetical protein